MKPFGGFHLQAVTALIVFSITSIANAYELYPTVTIRNGSYKGVHNVHYNQDMFLGIPYAQPPLGSLRFEPPASLNSTFSEVKSAQAYGPSCVGYGVRLHPDLMFTHASFYIGPMSEDCLTINVIRPTLENSTSLPVAVWIYGGGFYQGYSSSSTYNLSAMVQESVNAGMPFIGITLNYRLSAFGWLWSQQVKAAGGSANVGLRDQRLALHWIQENIGAFGGDPRKVTIWGQSAGGQSVGHHLTAYGGRDDGLFRGAIMESGSCLQKWPYWVGNVGNYTEQVYKNLTDATNCTGGVPSSYQCLKNLPFDTLNNALNITNTWMSSTGEGPWLLIYDGDFVQDYPSTMLTDGRFVKVPIIYGTNTDEGSVSGKYNINTDADFRAALALGGPDNITIETLETLYPNINAIGIPRPYVPTALNDTTYGKQWKRIFAFYGDASQHTPRRSFVKSFANHSTTAFSYRFDIIQAGVVAPVGVTHGAELASVFNHITAPSSDAVHVEAGQLMSRMWISFFNYLDPNNHNVSNFPVWPKYNFSTTGLGQNFVFSTDPKSYVEDDTWRVPNIEFLWENSRTQFTH